MNIQALHVILFILVTVILLEQATIKKTSEIIQSSQSHPHTITVAEESAQAAAEARKVAEIASQVPTEDVMRTDREVTQRVEKEQMMNREKIIISTRSNTFNTLNCEEKDVDLLPDDLNIALTGQCGRVSVFGPNSVINIAMAESIQVVGPNTVVNIGRVDHIRVSAPNAKIYYSSTLTMISNTPKTEIFGPEVTVSRR